MAFDWNQQAHPGGVARTAAVLLSAASTSGIESVGSGPSTADRLARLDEALATATPAAVDADRQDMVDAVREGARSGLTKIEGGEPPEAFTLAEHAGIESVVLTNGERPSLFVRDGFVDIAAPDVGQWDISLMTFQAAIRKVIASVGRIDVPVEPWYAGTCFVLAPGLVVTNRHVLEAIASQQGPAAWTLKWPGQTTVNFNGEDGADPALGSAFKVVNVAFAGPDPINGTINFAHLDLAVLRLDPESDKAHEFPAPVTFATDAAQPKQKGRLYVLGFPGQPHLWLFDGIPRVGTETMQVVSGLFNSKFGVKRLAPGRVLLGPGQVADDAKGWICTHDASTLLGNSGSCVVDLDQDGSRIVALHFAGANRAQNWAHAASHLHDVLTGLSATFVA